MPWENLHRNSQNSTTMSSLVRCGPERKNSLCVTAALVTVVSLIAMGLTDNSFRYHLESAKKNGITASEMAEIITHVAFYVGWPKAWAAFRMAKEVYEA